MKKQTKERRNKQTRACPPARPPEDISTHALPRYEVIRPEQRYAVYASTILFVVHPDESRDRTRRVVTVLLRMAAFRYHKEKEEEEDLHTARGGPNLWGFVFRRFASNLIEPNRI
jgi:hypothetical protein